MKKLLLVTAAVLAIGGSAAVTMFSFIGTARAEAATCVVHDPTGTPLNLRAGPSGPIIGTLRNGTPVVATDVHGIWWRITPLGRGKSGWVYSKYLSDCDILT